MIKTKAYIQSPGDRSGSITSEEIFALAHCLKKGFEFIGSYGFNPRIPDHFDTHYSLSLLLGLPLPVRNLTPDFLKGVEIKPEDYSKKVYPDANQLLDKPFIEMLRSKFLAKFKHPPIITNPYAAIHIRRGDVKVSNTYSRYTSNAYYLEIVRKLKSINPAMPILIFSESDSSESFDEFSKLGCNLHLNTDLVFSWIQMIFATVLVMAKSSFCYVPAIYNSNFVIYQPAWYQKLNHWHSIEDKDLWNSIRDWI